MSERIGELRERLTSLLEGRQNNSMASQITDFTKRVAQVLEEGQRSVTPSVSNLQVWSAHLNQQNKALSTVSIILYICKQVQEDSNAFINTSFRHGMQKLCL